MPSSENNTKNNSSNGLPSPASAYAGYINRIGDTMGHGDSLDLNVLPGQEHVGKSIDRSITPNHEPRVFFFDIDNCLYSKDSGIHDLMRIKIESYFERVGFSQEDSKSVSYRYYLDYGLAIRGLVVNHPDERVDDALPLEDILHPNKELREMILSLQIEKKWLFTNAGKKHALRVIKCLGLEGCFDGLTYCDYNEPNFACKPETESFRRAMRDAGVVHPSNCFLIDDSAANIDKAMDLGWTAVHVADDPKVSTFGNFQIGNIVELRSVLPHLWKINNNFCPYPPRNSVPVDNIK